MLKKKSLIIPKYSKVTHPLQAIEKRASTRWACRGWRAARELRSEGKISTRVARAQTGVQGGNTAGRTDKKGKSGKASRRNRQKGRRRRKMHGSSGFAKGVLTHMNTVQRKEKNLSERPHK